MAQALTPASSTTSTVNSGSNSTTSSSISPAKLADLRSNYLLQLRDLHSLYESGAISESEFQEQKAPIFGHLK